MGGVIGSPVDRWQEREIKEFSPDDVNDDDSGEKAKEIRKRVYLGRLVKGMYDWYKGAKEYEEWWTSAHYDLLELDELLADDELNLYAKELQDQHKKKTFGVFRRRGGAYVRNEGPGDYPHWVVGIRGNLLWSTEESEVDFRIFVEDLNYSKLITIMEVVVRRLVVQHGHCNVNVTGHSLGAAMGLLVCRRLALEGCLVDGHFFEPPFITRELPPDRDGRGKAEFETLAKVNWSPYLYLNTILCSRKFFADFFGEEVDEDKKTKTFHLFPSANIVMIGQFAYRIFGNFFWLWLRPDLPYFVHMSRAVTRFDDFDSDHSDMNLKTDASYEVPEEEGSANERASIVENRINDELYVLYEPSDGLPYDTEILFVHDLYTEGCRDAWWTTWINEDRVCWPREFLAKKFPRARMLSVSYDACVTTNSTQGRMDSLYVIAENLMHNLFLQNSNVGQTPNCPVFFVGHGLGCFVIKKLMITVDSYREYHHQERKYRLMDNVGGFVFYSPFNFGVKWNLYEFESGQKNPLANNLIVHHPELSRLNGDFSKLRRHMQNSRESKLLWSVLTICESHQTPSKTVKKSLDHTFSLVIKHQNPLCQRELPDPIVTCSCLEMVTILVSANHGQRDKLDINPSKILLLISWRRVINDLVPSSYLSLFRHLMKINPDQFRVELVSIRRWQRERELSVFSGPLQHL